jgi:hypothetical protein
MIKRILTLIGLILVVFLTSCSQAKEVTMGGTPVPDPETGKATAIGRALWKKDGAPYRFTLVRLAEVVRQGDEGLFVLDQAFSPGSRTDENGYFVFKNIPAGEYVLVVGDVMTVYKIIPEQGDQAKVFDIPADVVTDLGTVRVDLSP